jgi:hypothetical protein
MADIRRKGMIVSEPGQPEKAAELMEVVKSDERWNVYDLDDGTQLRMKAVVLEIWKLIDEFDADGNPKYVVRAQGTMSVLAPEALKKGNKPK